MKYVLFAAMICMTTGTLLAQPNAADTTRFRGSDTAKTVKKNHKGFKMTVSDGDGSQFINVNDTVVHHKNNNHGFKIGITIARLDLGFTTLIDNGSFTLSKQNQFLQYRSIKSSNPGFDVFQMGYRFNDNFKLYLSGGFDWTLIRLEQNITILPNQPTLTYRQDNISYSKNRFSSSYLRIPLSFDFRTNEDANGRRFHFVFGPDGGFLLNGRVKQISTENGKQKFDNEYHFARFRYGAFLRVGYGAWGVFAKYYANDMFENSPQQAGLKNFSYGIMLGF
jgi:hypothetical protein